MKKTARFLQSLLLLTLLFTQFNNCGSYAPTTGDASVSSVSCTTANCITPVLNNLRVEAHLYGGEITVQASSPEFNVGGDCNEGGYPLNKIRWELVLNGVTVRHSSMQGTGSPTADTRCINGRFLLYVNLAPITEDPVNRTGLMIGSGATRSSYNLNVILYGQQSTGDPGVQSTQSRVVVPLGAI